MADPGFPRWRYTKSNLLLLYSTEKLKLNVKSLESLKNCSFPYFTLTMNLVVEWKIFGLIELFQYGDTPEPGLNETGLHMNGSHKKHLSPTPSPPPTCEKNSKSWLSSIYIFRYIMPVAFRCLRLIHTELRQWQQQRKLCRCRCRHNWA